jgi:hypothetical protein
MPWVVHLHPLILDRHLLETEQVSSGTLVILPVVGEIAQLRCRLYSERPSLFRPVLQLEKKEKV